MPHMTYHGDHRAGYTHDSGTGLVGKVVGPSATGRYFLITEAEYDEEADLTRATVLELRRPDAVLDEMTGAR